MTDLEIKAEVFRVMRANSHIRSARAIYEKIREHLPDLKSRQIAKALEELAEDRVKSGD